MTRTSAWSKYHATSVIVDNIRFSSVKESRRYQQLKLLQKIGEIRELELQVPLALDAANFDTGEIICCGHYVADFRYFDVKRNVSIIEDTKGFRTPMYRLKKRWVEAQYGIQITEL